MDYDFSFLLVCATFVTGLIWAGYELYLKLNRSEVSGEFLVREPIIIEYAKSFFPVVLIVLILRSFIVEPFRIPSNSMMPTLLTGDFILVNKFTYGLRLPVLFNKLVELNEPVRGDIVVFRFPQDPTVDYIKRVIGLPGDKVQYRDKQVYINDQLMSQIPMGLYQGVGSGSGMTGAQHITEHLGDVKHEMLVRTDYPRLKEGLYTVPQGMYFVMGDNRDNSNDSRYWGYVPEANLVGRAFMIWMNWDWKNKGIELNRLGTILE